MSLAGDIAAIDLSAIVNARGAIRAAFDAPELKALLDGGVAKAALGDLGAALEAVRDGKPDALLALLGDTLHEVHGSLAVDPVLIDELADAVHRGATIWSDLLAAFRGEPSQLAQLLGVAVGDIADQLGGGLAGFGDRLGRELSRLPAVLAAVERGGPDAASALAATALELLLPVPPAVLHELRALGDELGGLTPAVAAARTSGLVRALDAVAEAADAGDAAGLSRALAALDPTRASTVSALRDELLAISAQLGRFDPGALVGRIERAAAALAGESLSAVGFLRKLDAVIAEARAGLALVDPAVVAAYVPGLLDRAEAFARNDLAAPIDALVARATEGVQQLFRALPLRELRDRLRRVLHDIAAAIDRADLGRFGRELHDRLAPLRSAVSSIDLPARVKAAVDAVAATVGAALDKLTAGLGAIRSAIDAAAGEAVHVLERGAAAIDAFKTEMDRLRGAVDQLGIEPAAQQVIAALHALRDQGEKLFSQPLPEPLRPVVEQAIAALQSLHVDDIVTAPLQQITGQLRVPDAIRGEVTAGLHALSDALANLVPAQLVQSLEAEIGAALGALRKLQPAHLLDEVKALIGRAADAVAALDPTALAGPLEAPFRLVQSALDALAPEKLLKPVLDRYDTLIGGAAVPGSSQMIARATTWTQGIGDTMGQALLAPVQAVTGGSAATAADPPEVALGDVVRAVGYVPARLREAIAALEPAAARALAEGLHALGGGLVRDLVAFEDRLGEVEARVRDALDRALLPLAAAQVRAHVAVEARVVDGSFEAGAAFDQIHDCSPHRLRDALAAPLDDACGRARTAAEATLGAGGRSLALAARTLDRFALPGDGGVQTLLDALDVEPLAAAFEALVRDAIKKAASMVPTLLPVLQAGLARLRSLIDQYNPAAQAVKFLSVLQVLRAELEVVNPHQLVAELGVVHQAIARALAAYDPARLLADLAEPIHALAAQLRALDPAALLGDLSPLDALTARIDALVPAQALHDAGAALTSVGAKLAALDPAALLADVDGIHERVDAAVAEVGKELEREIVAVLQSLRYASAHGSASVSVEAHA